MNINLAVGMGINVILSVWFVDYFIEDVMFSGANVTIGAYTHPAVHSRVVLTR